MSTTPRGKKNHGEYLAKANQRASIIAIEGGLIIPYGESLDKQWNDLGNRDYGELMRETARLGWKGLFTEIDMRDISRVKMDFDVFLIFLMEAVSSLPALFFSHYFAYLTQEHPYLAKQIGSPEKLKDALIARSFSREGIFGEEKEISVFQKGMQYYFYPFLAKDGGVSLEPMFLELGQFMFTDAMAALKLHLIARIMAEGHIPKGPIVDYEGALHVSNKSFFLRYPRYAMEVVLRTINELMAGKVKNIEEVYKVFQNPDWTEIAKEILRLHFKKVEGPDGQLSDYQLSVSDALKIDPNAVFPTKEEIARIQEKLRAVRE